MGAEVCRAVAADEQLTLVAAIDPHHGGVDLRQVTGLDTPLAVEPDIEALTRNEADVAVDFTGPDAVLDNLLWCAGRGIHAVVGTTGLGDAELDQLRRAFTSSNCLVAPNFAIGALLMMAFAKQAAPWFDSVEIVELHHDRKLDAPSGTAMLTAQRIAEGSDQWGADPTRTEVLPGARGGVGPADIRVHSVRLRGLVAHQEVLLGAEGQTLTIRHDSYDRTSFMPGVVLAVKQVAEHPGVMVGLDALLGL